MHNERLSPGHVPPLCPGCDHFDRYMYDQGHPNPCAMVRWIGPKHVKPSLTIDADGVAACSDFAPSQEGVTP